MQSFYVKYLRQSSLFRKEVRYVPTIFKTIQCNNCNWRSAKSKINHIFFLFGIGALTFVATNKYHDNILSYSEENKSRSNVLILSRNFVADAIELVAPAVVNVMCSVHSVMGVGISSGSGFIISDDGFIVTNAHVVASAPEGKVVITSMDGIKRTGTVHSIDIISDIAIVKIDNSYIGEAYPTVSLGTSAKLRGGEFVIAIGSPLQLQNSASLGIISATARHASELGLANSRSEYIQTDAAVNQGNSGGPLINLDGEVIGINTLKLKGGDGISFAIPIDVANQVIKQLIKYRKVTRPYVGLKMANYIPENNGSNGNENGNKNSGIWPFSSNKKKAVKKSPVNMLMSAQTPQVMVLDVVPGSPAHNCGLRSGDIIKEANGKPVKGVRDILDIIGMEVGKKIELKVNRDGNYDDLALCLITAPEIGK